MTVFLILEAPDTATLDSRIGLLRTAYGGKRVRGRDAPNNENLGTPQYNKLGTKAFFGTTRASLGNIVDLANERSWLTLTRDGAWQGDVEWQPK